MPLKTPRSLPVLRFALLMLALIPTVGKSGDVDTGTRLNADTLSTVNNDTVSPASQQVTEAGSATANIVLSVSSTAPNTLTFSWSAYSGADHYKLLASHDGTSDYVQSGNDITGTRVDVTQPGHPLDWVNARYRLDAYDSNNTLIGRSSAISITNQLLSHPNTTGASDNFGWSTKLSSDGNTLAVGTPVANPSTTDSKASSATGGVYLFQRDATMGGWKRQAYVKRASNGIGDLWAAHIDLEAKLGNKRSLGEAGMFVPITQNSHRLVFTDLRGRFDDNSSHEFNLGLGLRHMREDGWNLGLYGYLDQRRSEKGYDYNQATLGVEALGRDWDFRANGYSPLGTRVHDSGSVSSAAISGTSVLITTGTGEEHALPGFDAEAGWRAPLFDSEANRQLRLYVGGYHFSDSGLTVEGPRLRAELTMGTLSWFGGNTSLFLGAEAQHDDARGSQYFVSARLRVPLSGKGEKTYLTTQQRRMTAPVVRDVDIMTQNRVATLVETATTTGGQAITALDSATTTGAALPGAVTAAGANTAVILSGTFNTTAIVSMQSGQSLLAGTVAVQSASGHTATLTTSATIATSSASVTVLMANNATLGGLTVNNTYNVASANAVRAQGVTGATISNNTLSAGGSSGSYTVDALNSVNLVVSGNTIAATSTGASSAIGIRALGANNLSIAGNTLNMSGTTQYVVAGSNTTVFNTAASTGNVTNSGSCFFVGAPTGSVEFSTITCP